MNLKRLHALKTVTWAIKSTGYNLLKLSYLKTFLLFRKIGQKLIFSLLISDEDTTVMFTMTFKTNCTGFFLLAI